MSATAATRAALLAGLAAHVAVAQEPLRAVAPQPYVQALAAVLPEHLGVEVRVAPYEGGDEDPAVAAWLLDEWTVSRRMAADGGQLAYLPFATDHVLVAAADAFVPRAWTWQELALESALHDRLALVDPVADAGAWAAMLRGELQLGRSRRDVLALWTTFDARAGRLCQGHPQAMAEFTAGRAIGWIAPRGLALRQAAAIAVPHVRHDIAASRVRLGVLVGPAARAAWEPVLDGLGDEALAAIAAAASVEVNSSSEPPLPPELAVGLLADYEALVRGQGRSTEALADWIDLAFVVGSLVVLLLVWRAMRRVA